MTEIEITTAVSFDVAELSSADIAAIVDTRRKDISRELLAELFEERFGIDTDVMGRIMSGETLAGWGPEEWFAEESRVDDKADLNEAIDRSRRARADDPRCLPDILHYLIRAIPGLAPIVPLIERETGRRLLP